MMEAISNTSGSREVGRVLIIDDDESFCILAQRLLQAAGYAVVVCHTGQAGIACLNQMIPDVLCLDLGLPDISGTEVLDRVRANHRLVTVIILTGDSTVESVVSVMRRGAWDYLTKPIDRARLVTLVRNGVEHSRMLVRLLQLQREVNGDGYPGIIGRSPAMQAVFRRIDRVVASDITVLLRGESGTGKELVAQAIHNHGGRSSAPFVALNCAAVPESLQESELFGHERGAFTGALQRRCGRFELANRGTLFLDEVAELSPTAQAKLLRVLQEHRFQRLGGTGDVSSDFRLIAATHRDLAAEVQAGRFREDLYFRIAVFELELPALRERGDDVIVLAAAMLARSQRQGGRPLALSLEAAALLRSHDWPGNVRELQNVIQCAILNTSGPEILPSDLPARLQRAADRAGGEARPTALRAAVSVVAGPEPAASSASSASSASANPGPGMSAGTEGSLEALEREAILRALRESRGGVREAARRLGIGRSTLYRKIKQGQGAI